MYREKITHCSPIIENIYGKDYPFICKDSKDLWIEIKTEEEATLIQAIEYHQSLTFDYVKRLQEWTEK